jgi:CO/xanthine dehydrogenase Mo-binding subunit
MSRGGAIGGPTRPAGSATVVEPGVLERGTIGPAAPRADAVPKVRGAFAYSSDLGAPGMLWGHTLRSPLAHARIRSIEIGAALGAAGVHAVLTHADVPGEKHYGLEVRDQPVLAIDRVRYFGEPVALVAADHPEQARRAAGLIRVEYEPLEPVTDMERATDGPDLHPERPTEGHGYRPDPRPNVVRTLVIAHGDPAAEGDVAVEGVYETGIQDQAFLGPESGLAVPDGEGGVDIHVATQWLHVDHAQIAPCLGLAPERVRVHLAGVGGAFGGREDVSMQIHAALLALHTGRAVKMVSLASRSICASAAKHVWTAPKPRIAPQGGLFV